MIDKRSDELLIKTAIKGQRWVEAIKEELTSNDHKIVKHYFPLASKESSMNRYELIFSYNTNYLLSAVMKGVCMGQE